MKMKMECRNAAEIEKQLIKKNDRYRYEIEKYKRMAFIERYAEENGMKQLTPYDFETLIIKK